MTDTELNRTKAQIRLLTRVLFGLISLLTPDDEHAAASFKEELATHMKNVNNEEIAKLLGTIPAPKATPTLAPQVFDA